MRYNGGGFFITMIEKIYGKKVVVRSRDAGVFFGVLDYMDGETVCLSKARNIWSWEGATCLNQIARDGILTGEVSQAVDSIVLTSVCQVIMLTGKAMKNLEGQPEWKVER